jgi:hypothetical protein
MLKVPFYKNANFAQELIGWIVLRDNHLSVYPSDALSLKAILEGPVINKDNEVILSTEDPEAWLKALPLFYRGSYFWAGKAEEEE